MKFIRNLAISLFPVIFLCACNTTTDPADSYKGEGPEQIFQKGEGYLKEKSYSEAAKRYEALEVQYPLYPKTQIAQLHIIYAYYKNGDYASAEAAADHFIHTYPTSPHIDYAYYMLGLSNYYQNLGVFEKIFNVDLATRDLTQVKKSFDDFATVVRDYPNSPYAPAAYQYMIYLKNVMADYELHIAQYYYDRKAYVAAANRANTIVRHYQGASAVPDALVIMVKSYRALHLSQLEMDSLAVLNYNYPNSSYVRQAMAK
jgi:outer membrane protein assembly factor BamD